MASGDGSQAHRGWRRRGLAGTAVALAVLGAAGLAGWLADAEADPVVEVPAVGEVTATWLTDDLPVLLVHDTDGLAAFDARSPVTTAGRRGLLGWCADERQIVDPVAERSWTADGDPFARRDEPRDEPQPTLASWEVEVEAEGRLARIQQPQPSRSRTPVARAALWSRCQTGELTAPDPLAREAGPVDVADLAARDDGLHRVRATLEQVGQAAPRLCDAPTAGEETEEADDADADDDSAGEPGGRRCEPDALPTALGDWQTAHLPAPDEGVALRLYGELLVTVESGDVVEVLVPPGAAEPERAVVTGVLTVRGTVVDADDEGALGLPGVAEGTRQPEGPLLVLDDPLLVEAPRHLPRSFAGHRARVPLADDVEVAEALGARGADVPEPAALGRELEGIEVQAVVDRASGRAVSIDSAD